MFDYDTLVNFIHYDWPGNVRELKNSIERLVLLTRDNLISNEKPVVDHYEYCFDLDNLDDMENIISFSKNDILSDLDENKSLKEMVEEYEIKIIKLYIKKYGSLRKAAKFLKSSPATLSRKLSIYKSKHE